MSIYDRIFDILKENATEGYPGIPGGTKAAKKVAKKVAKKKKTHTRASKRTQLAIAKAEESGA